MCRWLRVLLVALALTAVWMLPGQGLAQIAGGPLPTPSKVCPELPRAFDAAAVLAHRVDET